MLMSSGDLTDVTLVSWITFGDLTDDLKMASRDLTGVALVSDGESCQLKQTKISF